MEKPVYSRGYSCTRNAKTLERDNAAKLGFAVLESIARPGEEISFEVIAEATGMKQQSVHRIFQRAMRRVRNDPRLSRSERVKYRCW